MIDSVASVKVLIYILLAHQLEAGKVYWTELCNRHGLCFSISANFSPGYAEGKHLKLNKQVSMRKNILVRKNTRALKHIFNRNVL